MRLTANATRSGDWWAVEVPEVDGLFTQAKRLDQIPELVADAAALLEDVEPADIEVEVRAALEGSGADEVHRVLEERAKVDGLQAALADELRQVARSLVREQKLSTRDAGQLLGISHQRVSQLLGMPSATVAKKSGGGRSRTRSARTGRIVTTTKSGRTTTTREAH